MRFQLMPSSNSNIFCRWINTTHKLYIHIEIPMVDFVQKMFLHDLFYVFQIDHKSGFRIRDAGNTHFNIIVVTVTVWVRTAAKEFSILLI